MRLKTGGFLYSGGTLDEAGLDWAAWNYEYNVNNGHVARYAAEHGIESHKFIPYAVYMCIYWTEFPWYEEYATAHNYDIEDWYYHADTDFDFQMNDGTYTRVLGWPNGSAASRRESRIPSRWAGRWNANISSPTWLEAFCVRNSMHMEWSNVDTLAGTFFDLWGMSNVPETHPEYWTEIREKGGINATLAGKVLENDTNEFSIAYASRMQELTNNPDFAVFPNTLDPSWLNYPLCKDQPAYTWHAFEFFTNINRNGYAQGSGAYQRRTWDMWRQMYDEMDAGRKCLLNVETKYSQETAFKEHGVSPELWHDFCQQLLTSYYLVQHENSVLCYHEGDAGYYGIHDNTSYEPTHWHPNMYVPLGAPKVEPGLDAWGGLHTDRFYIAGEGDEAHIDKVLGRKYENGMVLGRYYGPGIQSLGNLEPIVIDLGGTYRRLLADNTLGPPVTTHGLHNGCGAILMKDSPSPPPVRTFKAVKSGNFDDPTTWDLNGVPEPKDVILVDGYDVYIAGTTESIAAVEVTNNGTLRCQSGHLRITERARFSSGKPHHPVPSLTITMGGRITIDGGSIDVGENDYIYIACSKDSPGILESTNEAGCTAAFNSKHGLIQGFGRISMNVLSRGDGGSGVSLIDTTFYQCGMISIDVVENGAICQLLRTKILDDNAVSTAFVLRGLVGNTGNQTVTQCSFDTEEIVELHPRGFEFRCNAFASPVKVLVNKPEDAWSVFEDNLIYQGARHATDSFVINSATAERCLFVESAAESDNYISAMLVSTHSDAAMRNCILDSFTGSISGPADVIIVGGNSPYRNRIQNCAFLPNALDLSPGKFVSTVYQQSTTSTEIEHCTYVTTDDYEDGIGVGENITSTVNEHKHEIAALRSCLVIGDSDKPGMKAIRQGSQFQDHFDKQRCSHNWHWDIAEGSDGNGWHAWDNTTPMFSDGTPDDVVGTGDPRFVDIWRCVAMCTVSDDLPPKWSPDVPQAKGDVCIASVSNWYDNRDISFVCIAPHQSSEATRPMGPGKWWEYWRLHNVQQMLDDPTLIPEIHKWIAEGLRPQNKDLRDAGHDGKTIGALEGVFPDDPPPPPVPARDTVRVICKDEERVLFSLSVDVDKIGDIKVEVEKEGDDEDVKRSTLFIAE